MNASPRFLSALVLGLALSASGFAEEKNGLMVTVSKTTLDRADTRTNSYYERIDRTQGLKVVIKNMSFKPRPEGEVQWQILVRKYSSSDLESSTGTEKLKPLRASETAEMVIGSANIQGWQGYDNLKDRIEWQVVIKHDGTETAKLSSTAGFDALAKRAARK